MEGIQYLLSMVNTHYEAEKAGEPSATSLQNLKASANVKVMPSDPETLIHQFAVRTATLYRKLRTGIMIHLFITFHTSFISTYTNKF